MCSVDVEQMDAVDIEGDSDDSDMDNSVNIKSDTRKGSLFVPTNFGAALKPLKGALKPIKKAANIATHHGDWPQNLLKEGPPDRSKPRGLALWRGSSRST